jgi:hypothetical protein
LPQLGHPALPEPHHHTGRSQKQPQNLCLASVAFAYGVLGGGWKIEGDRSFGGNGVNISAEIGVMTMAASEAQKRATYKYLETEKGKEAFLKAARKYQSTERGQEALKAAQDRYAASEKAREARKRYESSEKGKAAKRAANLRRKERLALEQQENEKLN